MGYYKCEHAAPETTGTTASAKQPPLATAGTLIQPCQHLIETNGTFTDRHFSRPETDGTTDGAS
ncbi:MAG: hypothetical protein ACTTI9_02810, partial [Schaalia odontolytica]